MPSHQQDEAPTGLGLGLVRRDKDSHDRGSRPEEPDNLGYAASNRAVTVTLIIGVSLMLLVLMLPYLSEL